MRISRLACLAFCLTLFVSATALLFGADLNGKWKSTDEGGGPSFAFAFKADGNTLTGSMTSMEGKELPISDGKLDGNNLSFTVNSEWQGNPVKLLMKGTATGPEEIHLRIDTEDGAWGTDVVLKRSMEKDTKPSEKDAK